MHSQTYKKLYLLTMVFIISVVGIFCFPSSYRVLAEDVATATPIIPTVTGTASGPYISVRSQEQDQINIRSGPGMSYPKVGILLIGQQMPAKGKSSGGDWILIEYPGVEGGEAWVYSPLVDLFGGELPIVEPPPTPTPKYTPTIDPTLEARYVITHDPTSLPTFTEPAQIIFPTMQTGNVDVGIGGVPYGLIIIVMAAIGLLIGIIAFIQNR